MSSSTFGWIEIKNVSETEVVRAELGKGIPQAVLVPYFHMMWALLRSIYYFKRAKFSFLEI